MKTAFFLSLLCFATGAFAQVQSGPRDPRDPRQPYPPRDELRECRMNLDQERYTSNLLRSENLGLRKENTELRDENARQFEEIRRLQDELDRNGPGRLQGFFSYAGCTSPSGVVDFKFLAAAEGSVPLMSETNARMEVSKKFSCNFGIGIAKTEEIKSNNPSQVYCVAGCTNPSGQVDPSYARPGTGRNHAEAEFTAIQALTKAYTCNFGIKIQACQ